MRRGPLIDQTLMRLQPFTLFSVGTACSYGDIGKSYELKSLTNSTRLRTAIPDGPFAIQGLASSVHAVPAMSRCSQGVSSANSFRNIAAVTAPPQRPPELTMSA